MNAMPNTITRLEGLSSQLIESSDKLSQEITTLESKLGALKLDIAVWVKDPFLLEEKNEEDGGLEDFAYAYFGYAKINDAWRLWIKKDGGPTLDAGESNGVHPHYVQLNQAPRDIRLKALHQFPQLIMELERQTEAVIEEVETAKMIAEIGNRNFNARPGSPYLIPPSPGNSPSLIQGESGCSDRDTN